MKSIIVNGEKCCVSATLYDAIYQQGRADAKKEINGIMDMDLPISNILFEIDKWLKEKKND